MKIRVDFYKGGKRKQWYVKGSDIDDCIRNCESIKKRIKADSYSFKTEKGFPV